MKSLKLINGFFILFTALILLVSCEKNSPVNSENTKIPEITTAPKIISLTANKSEILFGGEDPAFITCVAEGGNITYEWHVDLGNILPYPNDNSKIRFTGSPCCIGKKLIECKVSNDKGTDSKIIEIFIKTP